MLIPLLWYSPLAYGVALNIKSSHMCLQLEQIQVTLVCDA